jgi:hypothetical protein
MDFKKNSYSIISISITMTLILGVISSNDEDFSALSQQLPTDQTELQDLISKSLDYVHQGDISTTSTNILLNGINLTQGEFILLYDSTPFASKGHIAVNLPCDPNNPLDPIFDILVGRAPDLVVLPLGYLEQISKPGKMCVYHGQFGFGDPITDLILKYVGDDESIKLEGPHSIVITTHETFKPTTESFFERHHNVTNQ